MEDLKERIKSNEGFRDTIYKDKLGKATIGYGHLVTPEDNLLPNIQYSKQYLNELFEKDFDNAVKGSESLINFQINEQAKKILIEMVFQLGVGGVSKFKNMLNCLSKQDYVGASKEMINSNWHKQTPNRCEQLANIMRTIND